MLDIMNVLSNLWHFKWELISVEIIEFLSHIRVPPLDVIVSEIQIFLLPQLKNIINSLVIH